jgi:hypothetical protein
LTMQRTSKWLIVVALMFAALPAHAQWYNWPYAPWRIQPGSQAPPVPDPYMPARAAQAAERGEPLGYAPLPPTVIPSPPPPVEAPPPYPIRWVWRYYAPCADPGCGMLRVEVGADGLNVRVAPAARWRSRSPTACRSFRCKSKAIGCWSQPLARSRRRSHGPGQRECRSIGVGSISNG